MMVNPISSPVGLQRRISFRLTNRLSLYESPSPISPSLHSIGVIWVPIVVLLLMHAVCALGGVAGLEKGTNPVGRLPSDGVVHKVMPTLPGVLEHQDKEVRPLDDHERKLLDPTTDNAAGSVAGATAHGAAADAGGAKDLTSSEVDAEIKAFEDKMKMFRAEDEDQLLPDLDAYNPRFSFPTSSFNLAGRYVTLSMAPPTASTPSKTISQEKTNGDIPTSPEFIGDALSHTGSRVLDQGSVRVVILSKPTVIHSVRLTTVKLYFDSELLEGDVRKRQIMTLSGVDLRDISALTFQGTVSPAVFDLATNSTQSPEERRAAATHGLPPDAVPPMCQAYAVFRFDRFPGESRSVREIDAKQNGGDADWGFDVSDFGSGGTWDGSRRRLLKSNSDGIDSRVAGGIRVGASPIGAVGVGNHGQPQPQQKLNDGVGRATALPTASLEAMPSSAGQSSSDVNQTATGSVFQDLEGVIVSPNCRVRIVLSGMEIDLSVLSRKILYFALFFGCKSLFEIRFLLAQVEYTGSGASSTQKVCVMTLALHLCVNIFEALILLTQAIDAGFMPAVFILLSMFKILVAIIIEFRYLFIVLRARLTETELSFVSIDSGNGIARFMKFNAIGSMLMLISILRLLPVLPSCVICLYFFWVPQICYDAWKGNRLSLSFTYVVGISLCRILFPLYLWGYTKSPFNGDLFRKLPSAPNVTLCVVLVVAVTLQVVMLYLQRLFGPRAFFPECLLPKVYNYYRPLPVVKGTEEGRGYECVICMTDITYNGVTLVTTPCDHCFHDSCLQQWIDVKSECPTCRGPLPPLL